MISLMEHRGQQGQRFGGDEEGRGVKLFRASHRSRLYVDVERCDTMTVNRRLALRRTRRRQLADRARPRDLIAEDADRPLGGHIW